MIQANNLGKSFGQRVLFENVTFSISKNERVGLVGRNGTGKSTLFRMIQGEEGVSLGELTIPKNYTMASIDQHLQFTEPNILAECARALSENEKYDLYKVEKVLMGLGFSVADFERAPTEFSGGFQIRLNLAKVILKKPNMLLLDEPTNYLDIVSLRWLRQFLSSYPGEVILITHDKRFMDSIVTHVMGLSRRGLRKVKGATDNYYHQLKEADEVHEKTRVNQERQRKEMENFVNKFRAKARQASLAQSRQKMLDKMQEIEKLETETDFQIQFNHKEMPAKVVLEVEDLAFGYGDEPLFQELSFHLGREDKVAIIGKNGKGKSTLLNILYDKLNPSRGSAKFHSRAEIGYFGQTNISRLHDKHTVEQEISLSNSTLSSQQCRSIAGSMMFSGDDSQKKISVLSGGEKARVLLGKILANPSNLLFLDEPTNHLDIESVESLTQAIEKFPGASLIVTHNEEMLHRLATKLIVFQRDNAFLFEGSYAEFLDKIGWEEDGATEEEEKTEQVVSTPEGPKLNRKEYKLKRQEIIKERSSQLGPLKKEYEKLEHLVIESEELLESKNSELIQQVEAKNSEEIATLSKQIDELENTISESFERLETLSDQIAEKTESFENRLSELDRMV